MEYNSTQSRRPQTGQRGGGYQGNNGDSSRHEGGGYGGRGQRGRGGRGGNRDGNGRGRGGGGYQGNRDGGGGGYQGNRDGGGGDHRPQTQGEGGWNQNRGDRNNRGGDRDGGYRGGRGGGRGGGGYQGNRDGGYQGGGGGGFGNKPSKSLVSHSCNPEEARVQKQSFTTNQFKMTIGKNAPQIFQYAISIIEEGEDDDRSGNAPPITPFELAKVVDGNHKKIELLIGKYIYSGYNIWTTQRLDESYFVDTKLMGRKVQLKIDHEGEYTVNTQDIHSADRRDSQAMSQIMNVIVKQAMSETGLLQFGHRPRFFDSTKPINVKELDMQIWGGFKASAYRYDSGCALILDNCARFMSTKSVLDRVKSIYDEVEDSFRGDKGRMVDQFQDKCRAEFTSSSVIANYGTKRTYIVKDIRFDQGPCSTFFELRDGTQISVAKYFYKQYNMKITDKQQPMLIMNQGGREISVPSEFCIVDGVPDSIRNNSRAMRTLLNQVKQNPDEKMKSIVKMVNNLFKMKKWAEWDITVDDKPQQLESRRLAVPELDHKEGADKKLFVNERLLKQMPVYSAEQFAKKTVFMVHDRYSGQEAENTKRQLLQCQGQMGMKCQSIQMIELPDTRGNWHRVQQEIDRFVVGLKGERGASQENKDYFGIVILNRSNEYPDVKKVFSNLGILTQMIQKFTAKKINLSVASNIMKQINSKLGGESLRMKWGAEFMHKDNVMVIGIDVCHAGKKSVVGFCASTNKHQTKYYSDVIINPKNQELITKELDRCIKNAVQEFKNLHDGALPDKLVIYRDGVGEQMRDQIIEKEITQFKEALRPLYNQVTGPPPITLVVVNKRINQRMFIQDKYGKVDNPQPGSIIDANLVENCQGNECFDFFLVPQMTTQGCVTPVHFFVSLNESKDISKADLENVTYAFCYMYSNWSGSIKVPAPCQYAHKIAEYHHSFDRGSLKHNKVNMKDLCYNEDFLNNFYYL